MKQLMPIENIPDWEKRLDRQEAFWNREIIDRPVVVMCSQKKTQCAPYPAAKNWKTQRERWFDFEYTAELTASYSANLDFWGDALPCVMPNLGPEVVSAFLGVELDYGESTAWSIPMPDDWDEVERLVGFSESNKYWKAINDFTDALLAVGKNRYYVGLTDCHPGGDGIAAFRDPMRLAIDLIENPDRVKAMLARFQKLYFELFDRMIKKLEDNNQAICTWAGPVCRNRWYVPSNDFSCMISKEMFDEFFLPGIADECRFYGHAIYHLDGPGALRHLPSLLSIPELNAIQWVCGSGHGRCSDWIPVYQQCQAAGKGIQIVNAEPDEIETLCSNLRPEGVWMSVVNVDGPEMADAIIKRVAKWK